jgi:uncharacterized protein YkwD
VGLLVSVLLILAGFFAAAYYVSTVLTGGGMAAVISSALVDLANDDRKIQDLPALSANPVLAEAARLKAEDMAEKGYFAHVSPDGVEPWHWFREAGYEYAAAGENLAVNFSDSENVEEAWMNSPAHRANILSAKFTEIGIATAAGEYKGKKTTFVVQMFGAPRALNAPRNDEPARVVTPASPEEPAIAVGGAPAILGTEEPAPETPAEPAVPTGEEPAAPAPAGVYGAPLPPPPALHAADAFARMLAFPASLLRALYLACGAVVIVALLLTTRLELRRHHLPQVAAAAFLLALMGGALFIADRVIFVAPVIAEAAGI